MWKMSSPYSIWHQDLNSWPLNHEFSPITTRPGLPPNIRSQLLCLKKERKKDDRNYWTLMLVNNLALGTKRFILRFYFNKNHIQTKSQSDSNSIHCSRRQACWPLDHHQGSLTHYPWSSLVEGGEGLYQPNCQTTLVIALDALLLLFVFS